MNLQYADLDEFVADKERDSVVVYIESSSPYFDKHVRALVKAVFTAYE